MNLSTFYPFHPARCHTEYCDRQMATVIVAMVGLSLAAALLIIIYSFLFPNDPLKIFTRKKNK